MILVLSELLSNVCKHTDASVCAVVAVWLKSQIIIGVADNDLTHLPKVAAADADDTDGRGLYLVEALAERWWCHVYEPRGVKVVCAAFPRHAAIPRQLPALL